MANMRICQGIDQICEMGPFARRYYRLLVSHAASFRGHIEVGDVFQRHMLAAKLLFFGFKHHAQAIWRRC